MKIINRGQCVYYVKDESVVLEYNNQFISFNVYKLQNRKKFKDFKKSIEDSLDGEYSDINSIMGLARSYGLIGMVGRKPIIE